MTAILTFSVLLLGMVCAIRRRDPLWIIARSALVLRAAMIQAILSGQEFRYHFQVGFEETMHQVEREVRSETA